MEVCYFKERLCEGAGCWRSPRTDHRNLSARLQLRRGTPTEVFVHEVSWAHSQGICQSTQDIHRQAACRTLNLTDIGLIATDCLT